MKTKWAVNSNWLYGIALTWFIGWFITFLVCTAIFRNHYRDGSDAGAKWVHSPIQWILPVWLGPYAAAALLIALYYGVPAMLMANPPIKRMTEPVLTDLREVKS